MLTYAVMYGVTNMKQIQILSQPSDTDMDFGLLAQWHLQVIHSVDISGHDYTNFDTLINYYFWKTNHIM